MEWLAVHGDADLSFTLPPLDMMPIGNLGAKEIALLAPAEVSREFLRWLDSGAKGEATLFQAVIVVRELNLRIDPGSESVWAAVLARGGTTH